MIILMKVHQYHQELQDSREFEFNIKKIAVQFIQSIFRIRASMKRIFSFDFQVQLNLVLLMNKFSLTTEQI